MVDIRRETYKKNGLETIVDNDGILWLNGKHIEEELDHKNLRAITLKYLSNHRKHIYEPVDKPEKQANRICIDKKLALKVIMDIGT